MNPLQENMEVSQTCTEHKQPSEDKENQDSFRQMKRQFAQKMALEPKKRTLSIQQCVSLQLQKISFSKVLPGNICEEELQLVNLTQTSLILQINVVCYNKEYEPLEEYVYSARKLQGYDYNDKIILALSPHTQNSIKVAIKAPNDKQAKIIYGEVFVSTTGTDNTPIQGVIRVPIQSTLEMPSILCQRMLFSSNSFFLALFQRLIQLPINSFGFQTREKT